MYVVVITGNTNVYGLFVDSGEVDRKLKSRGFVQEARDQWRTPARRRRPADRETVFVRQLRSPDELPAR